ncbi:uncharacterized protein LOC121377907 [Gigantopelta aegis]|uniref:uncharacterized protein LOC121377907 n=1 Tax=Gigantopelta aegis TaxID=1735272 RepID=UPI001B88B8A4|nr:uncharacterized protein LOC121377907 [Gigantopelta aegis]
MGPPQLSDAVRWQVIGMRNAGMSLRAIARNVGHHASTISRLVRKHQQTNDVKDLNHSGRPRVTSHREDTALLRLTRIHPFMRSGVLKREWLPNRRLSDRMVRNRLKTAGYRARRPVRRPLLTRAHIAARLAWCQRRRPLEFSIMAENTLVGRESIFVVHD